LRALPDFQVQWLGPPNQQGAVCVIRGRPSQGASAVLKGAPLAPLRFLHAHSCLFIQLHATATRGPLWGSKSVVRRCPFGGTGGLPCIMRQSSPASANLI